MSRRLFLTLCCALGSMSFLPPTWAAPAHKPLAHSSLQAEAVNAFHEGRFDDVLRLLEAVPSNQRLPLEVWRIGIRSALRVGRPEAALTFYTRLVPPGRPDEPALLREVAFALIARYARDPQEHLRIGAYMALAEAADRHALPLLEDGLLDTSVMVRARAAEGLARAGAPEGVLARALADPVHSVRIAALNALGTKVSPGLRALLVRLSKSDEGVIHIFALAALARLGQADAVDEIASEASLPDAELRMAALGVLGQLQRPASLRILSQSVYDPDPSVRAFAVGALGDLGNPKAEPALLHALEDEDPRVRRVAAASLGRLKLSQTRPLLVQAARDPVDLVRVGAVEGLLRLGDPDAVLLAADLAKHPDPSIRGAVAQAIALSGNSKAMPVVEALLKDRQPEPRLLATRAIGRLGGQTAIPLLKRALHDAEPAIRIAAAGGLLRVLPAR